MSSLSDFLKITAAVPSKPKVVDATDRFLRPNPAGLSQAVWAQQRVDEVATAAQ